MNNDFATVVADGSYTRFLDGFVSMLFYQERVYPTKNNDGDVEMPKNNEVIADIRLSIKQVRKLVNELKYGLELYPILALMTDDVNFTSGVKPFAKETKKHEEEETDWLPTKEEFELLRSNVILGALDNLTDEGKEKYNSKLVEIMLEHVDELREIVREYEKPIESK